MPGKTRKAKSSAAASRLTAVQQKQLVRSMMRQKGFEARARARQAFIRSLAATLKRSAVNKSLAASTRKQMKNATMKVEQELRRSVRLAAKGVVVPKASAKVPASSKRNASMLYPSILSKNTTRKISNINAAWKKRIQTIAKEAKAKSAKVARANNVKADPVFDNIAERISKIRMA